MTHRDDGFPLDRNGDLSEDTLDLDALRAAFAAVPVPSATPRLDASDDKTQAAVSWMADAFAALPVPVVEIPDLSAHTSTLHIAPAVRLTTDRSSRRSRPPVWMRHAAAAAVFATLTLSLWWARQDVQSPPTRPDVPSVTAGMEAAPRYAAIPGFRAASSGSAGLVAVTTDHLEVSSGPVRLVLMTTGSSRAGGSFQDLP